MEVRIRPDGSAEASSEKAKTQAKAKIRRVEIEPAENGGAAVRCMYDGGEGGYREPSLKAYGSLDEALAGVKAILGESPKAEMDDAEDED